MNTITKLGAASLVLVAFAVAPIAHAATSPGPDATTSFAILSSTYTNPAIGTVLNGDLGYTTPPAVAPTVNGTTFAPPSSVYTQAGIDQGSELSALNAQPCTFTFAPGAIDLAIDTTHGPVGVYTAGVYCISGAASVGSGTISLSGAGTFIFRVNGALTTAANTSVTTPNGGSPCNVWWTPTQASTLGATSSFSGTDIDASGVTVGTTSTWNGRALAFGGTVTTTTDTFNVPTCTLSKAPVTPTPTPTVTSTTPSTPNTGAAPSGLGLGVPLLVVLGGVTGIVAIRRRA